MPPIASRLLLSCLLALLAALGLAAGSAAAKPAQLHGGVIHACLVTKGGKGLARGTLRIVPTARSCKARRGERPVAWNLRGPSGPAGSNGTNGANGAGGGPGADGSPGANGSNGAAGARGSEGEPGASGGAGATGPVGPAGPPGTAGPIGATGPAGVVEQALLETIQSQANQIDALDADLKALAQELVDVKGTVKALQTTVAGTCTQLATVTSQVNKVSTAVGGLSLNNALALLGGLLNIPALPKALDPYTCS